MDWQPLIVAVAGVLVALTPLAVGYLTLQVRLLGLRADALERAAVVDRQEVKAAVGMVQATVVNTAAKTQDVVREQGGKAT